MFMEKTNQADTVYKRRRSGRTCGQTGKPSYRDAETHLRRGSRCFAKRTISRGDGSETWDDDGGRKGINGKGEIDGADR